MRKLAILFLPLLAFVPPYADAQSKKSKNPYQIEFDRTRDVEQLTQSPDGAKKGIYVKVRFAITLDGANVDKLEDYKLVIEEDGQRVKEVDVPRPTASEDLSVMLALDTSGSMKEHGRMEQARTAAAAFLKKLPARSDCGLILFDHEVREKLAPIYERPPLLSQIQMVQPRGGTAYLDAASEGIETLRATRRGRDRAVVLVTDGLDLNSKKLIQQVIAEALRDRTRIYTIGIGEPGRFEPVTTVLALDRSGSMKPPASDTDTMSKIAALHLAAQRYVDSMSTAGRCSIIPFSSRVGTPSAFMDKAQAPALKANIKRLTPFGETAVFDAAYDAVCLFDADGAKGKRAVLAMTDGKDNSSRRGVEEVIARAKEAKVPLYMLGFGRPGEIDEDIMRQMANQTGGKYYHAKNKDALLEIFENLSIQLHDDGIDETALKRLAKETGGQYFPAKNVSELKLILEQVTNAIQREAFEITFESRFQVADGRVRDVTLKLIRKDAAGTDEVIESKTGAYISRGVVIAEMNYLVYLIILVVLGGLIALPALLRRTSVG